MTILYNDSMDIFGDFQAFIDSGYALLNGQYVSQYPLPAVVLFALLSLFSSPFLLVLLIGISIIILVAMLKRRALLWIFFAPVLQTFALGQLTIVWLWLMHHASAWSLALLTLKPQLAILALPVLIRRRELWKPFAAWIAVIYVPVTLIRPTWPIEWFWQINDGRLNGTSSSLWPVPLLAFGILILLAFLRYDRTGGMSWPSLATVFNPAIRAYDYAMLTGMSLWLIPLSWIGVAGMWATGSAWPMAIVGVGAMVLGMAKDKSGD